MPYRTMTVQQVSEYLHLSPTDVEHLVKRGEIPSEKRGEQAIFVRSKVDAWASQRILGMGSRNLVEYHRASSAKVHDLSRKHALMPELMRVEWLDPAMKSKTKASVLRDMVALAIFTELVYDEAALLVSLEEREKLCPTAIGDGIALLHPRHHDPYMFADSFVILGRTIQPIHAGAQDGKPTDLFFLICCQDDSIHLHTLARICAMCQTATMLQALRKAEDAAGMLDAILAAENDVIGRL
jgi:PTS system nitrogen regulatory IIA component